MSNRDVPAKYKAMYKRAMTGKSRKAAMSVFCAECVGYVSSEIGLCSDKGCPLYPYRQVNANSDDLNILTQGNEEDLGCCDS